MISVQFVKLCIPSCKVACAESVVIWNELLRIEGVFRSLFRAYEYIQKPVYHMDSYLSTKRIVERIPEAINFWPLVNFQ